MGLFELPAGYDKWLSRPYESEPGRFSGDVWTTIEVVIPYTDSYRFIEEVEALVTFDDGVAVYAEIDGIVFDLSDNQIQRLSILAEDLRLDANER